MKNYGLVLAGLLLVISCKDAPEKKPEMGNDIEAVTSVPAEDTIELSDIQKVTSKLTLKKVNEREYENDPDYSVNYGNEGMNRLAFYVHGEYGVLEHYLEEYDASNYYIFPKVERPENELKVSLRDTIFLITKEEIDPEFEEYSELNKLLDNHIIIGLRGDASYPNYAIIDIKKRKVSGQFNTHGKYEVSADEKFLIGWEDSETNTDKDTICPEHIGTDMYDYYVVTEEFKYNLDTGEKTKTGKLGCGYVQ